MTLSTEKFPKTRIYDFSRYILVQKSAESTRVVTFRALKIAFSKLEK